MPNAKLKKESIRVILMIPLSLTILILLATSIIALHQLHNHHINLESQKSANQTSHLLKNQLKEDAELLKIIIKLIQNNVNLQNAWLARDRQSLFDYASPIFENIRSRNNVTHFYFHGLDRINFLRVHKPQLYGDLIDRFTMNQAADSGKSSWGIELGPLGTFTLRYVYPWRIDGKLAGYIELGEEIGHIRLELERITGTELFFVIDKSYLNRADWEQGLEMLGQKGNWDRYTNFIVNDNSTRMPPEIHKFLNKLQECKSGEHLALKFNASLNKQKFRVELLALIDAGGQDVGDIIVQKDITAQQASLNKILINQVAICSGISILLLVFFWQYTTQIERRVKLVKSLEFENREMQDIFNTTSHDLRSPLVTIEGFSEELKKDCDYLLKAIDDQGETGGEQVELLVKKQIPESLGFISAGVKKMSDLLEGLLQISRIGNAKVDCEPLDIEKTVAEVLSAMEFQIKESGVAVTVDSLPGCTGDKKMLNRVFTNLIGNAIKYRDPARKGEIRISGKVGDGMSIYCVADNGIGIHPKYHKKVFEIFQRVNPEDSISGEGLGLTIVTRIMDILGGRAWLESEPGKGSSFFVSMPTVKE